MEYIKYVFREMAKGFTFPSSRQQWIVFGYTIFVCLLIRYVIYYGNKNDAWKDITPPKREYKKPNNPNIEWRECKRCTNNFRASKDSERKLCHPYCEGEINV